TIVVAGRALNRARDSERRIRAVVDIAQAAGKVEASTDVTELLLAKLREMLPNRIVSVCDRPPDDNEIGAPLSTRKDAGRWIVVGAGRGYEFCDDERVTLQTLASVAAETLDRQRLVDEVTRLARYDVLTG